MVVETARQSVEITSNLWVLAVDGAAPLLLVSALPTPVWQPPRPAAQVAAAPAAVVTAAPAAVVTAITAITTVHRCYGDPGRLGRSGSGHRHRCGAEHCCRSSRHQQRCDVLQSDPHRNTPPIRSPSRV